MIGGLAAFLSHAVPPCATIPVSSGFRKGGPPQANLNLQTPTVLGQLASSSTFSTSSLLTIPRPPPSIDTP
jgi:hypothetical protein